MRLSMVLLLSILALMMAGLADVFGAYNKANTLQNSILDNDNHYVALKKEKKITYDGKTEYYDGYQLSMEEVKDLKE